MNLNEYENNILGEYDDFIDIDTTDDSLPITGKKIKKIYINKKFINRNIIIIFSNFKL